MTEQFKNYTAPADYWRADGATASSSCPVSHPSKQIQIRRLPVGHTHEVRTSIREGKLQTLLKE